MVSDRTIGDHLTEETAGRARSRQAQVALLREARSVLRRLDKLIADAAGSETSTHHLLAEARATAERIVRHLARQDHLLQLQAKEALRRGR